MTDEIIAGGRRNGKWISMLNVIDYCEKLRRCYFDISDEIVPAKVIIEKENDMSYYDPIKYPESLPNYAHVADLKTSFPPIADLNQSYGASSAFYFSTKENDIMKNFAIYLASKDAYNFVVHFLDKMEYRWFNNMPMLWWNPIGCDHDWNDGMYIICKHERGKHCQIENVHGSAHLGLPTCDAIGFYDDIYEKELKKETSKKALNKIYGRHEKALVESWIDRVIINKPATIIIWKDGTKTVVKCTENDIFDPEKGIAMCIVKKLFDDKSTRVSKFMDKWIPEDIRYDCHPFSELVEEVLWGGKEE